MKYILTWNAPLDGEAPHRTEPLSADRAEPLYRSLHGQGYRVRVWQQVEPIQLLVKAAQQKSEQGANPWTTTIPPRL